MALRGDGDLDLGADGVGARDQHRLLVAGGELETTGKTPQATQHALGVSRRHRLLDQLDGAVASIDIDTGVDVAEVTQMGAR